MSFIGQQIVITLDTGVTLSGADPVRIIYRKPSGETGTWTATVTQTTKVTYTTDEADLDEGGLWKMQAYAVVDGAEYYGELYETWVKVPIAEQ